MQTIQKKAKRNLLIGFGCSLVILISSSILSYLSITELLDSQKWVEHTVQVETGLNGIISSMKDAETGQRGFLLTGDDTFLEPYNGAQQLVNDGITAVQILTRDNNSQQLEFPLLEKLVNEKFSLIGKTISDKKRGIPPTALALNKGKIVMDSIRTVISTMITRENKLMVSRTDRMNKYVTVSPIAISLVTLIALIITFIFYTKVNDVAKQSALLHRELHEKDQTIQRQLDVISDVAQKVADGNYQVRVNKSDLE